MKIVVEVDEKSFEWLRNLIRNSHDNTLKGTVAPHLFDSIPYIQDWHRALAEPEIIKEQKIVEPKPKATVKQKRQVKKQKEAEKVWTCSSHNTFHGLRSPRTDCDECWELYATRNGVVQAKSKRAQLKRKLDIKK
jgi:hypothetical protein